MSNNASSLFYSSSWNRWAPYRQSAHTAMGVLALWGCLTFTGCTTTPEASPSASPTPPASYSQQLGHGIPARVDNLGGTAMLGSGATIAEYLNQPDSPETFFILLNSSAPTQGILVRANCSIPQELAEDYTGQLAVSGSLKAVSSPELAEYYRDKAGISLFSDAQGQLFYVDNESPLQFKVPKAVKSDGIQLIETLPQKSDYLTAPAGSAPPKETPPRVVTEPQPTTAPDQK